MILGLGDDMVAIARIEKLYTQNADRFLERCYSANEIAAANAIADETRKIAWLAKRFAAKEACAKALGTGISSGMNFYDIETLNDPNGRPIQNLSGKSLERLQAITPHSMHARIHVSLCDEPPLAKATVIIEAV